MAKIQYKSTRNDSISITSAEAILKGIADDGGLFIPTSIPKLEIQIHDMIEFDYKELAYIIMKDFLNDFSEDELRHCINNAYDDKFDTKTIAPLEKIGDTYFLELYHGPTLAFKDMALSILPYLLKTASKKLNIKDEIVILTATSGDTGKAALEGFADVEGIKIIVYFPEYGVSEIQKQQMVTQKGKNTYVIGIDGNFDDAQNGVKEMFNDKVLLSRMKDSGYVFSSANSINIGRLIPQIVYYFYAYLQMCKLGEIKPGESINFAVPTGNFGNILAGLYAKSMGLPINNLICASNENKVLYDFFKTGIYDKVREFKITNSPSMDILISSNLERYIYKISEDNAKRITELMKELDQFGKYELKKEELTKLQDIYGGFATEFETSEAIKDIWNKYSYIVDTHTGVSYSVYRKYMDETGDKTKTIIVSTASPYKFSGAVMNSLSDNSQSVDDYMLIEEMAKLMGKSVPVAVKDLDKKYRIHTTICSKSDMKQELLKILVMK